jgi:hypothetical protein
MGCLQSSLLQPQMSMPAINQTGAADWNLDIKALLDASPQTIAVVQAPSSSKWLGAIQ